MNERTADAVGARRRARAVTGLRAMARAAARHAGRRAGSDRERRCA